MLELVLALMVIVGNATSDPPIPRPTESKKQEQTQAKKREKEANKEERGSQHSPLIVEVLPAKGADETSRLWVLVHDNWWRVIWIELKTRLSGGSA